jgi:hypothetical protein
MEEPMQTQSAWSDLSELLTPDSAANAPGSAAGWGAVVPAPGARASVHGSIRPADVRPGDPVFARARLSTARSA